MKSLQSLEDENGILKAWLTLWVLQIHSSVTRGQEPIKLKDSVWCSNVWRTRAGTLISFYDHKRGGRIHLPKPPPQINTVECYSSKPTETSTVCWCRGSERFSTEKLLRIHSWDRDLVKQLTGQRTASKLITSTRWVGTRARDIVMWYWSVAILFCQLSVDPIVNVQYKRCGFAKTRLRYLSLPFDSLPYPLAKIKFHHSRDRGNRKLQTKQRGEEKMRDYRQRPSFWLYGRCSRNV